MNKERSNTQVTNLKEREYLTVDNSQKQREKGTLSKKQQSLFSKDWFKKFKTIKGIKIILLIMLLGVLLVGYISLKNSETKEEVKVDSISLSATEYCDMMERKLSNVLSAVKGAGNVQVMISLDSSSELVLATSTDTKTNTISNGNNTTTNITVVEDPIIVTSNGQSEPLVLVEKMPTVRGVIVVSSGASDVRIKLELIQAVQSLLDVEDENIQVITGI